MHVINFQPSIEHNSNNKSLALASASENVWSVPALGGGGKDNCKHFSFSLYTAWSPTKVCKSNTITTARGPL